MNAPIADLRITPEQLERMPDSSRYELVDGQLLERTVGLLSGLVEGLIYQALQSYCRARKSGFVWTGTTGIRCFPDDPDRVRRSDVTYLRGERCSFELLRQAYLTIPPDLVVEVISPHDTANEVEAKIADYLAAGIPVVWRVNPELRVVSVHRKNVPIVELHETDDLTDEEILPGFRCRVGEFFPPQPAVPPTKTA